MKTLHPTKHLVDQVYEVIPQALGDGTIAPGERITQDEIASRLNVSRQPVTQALAILKSQGFFTPAGKRGLTVTSIQPQFFADIYQLRSAIEPLAVTLAVPRMTAEALETGRKIIERGRASVSTNDAAASVQADVEFHSLIYDMAGNLLIADTMRLHWHHLRRAIIQSLRHPGVSSLVWQEHERILELMASGDMDVAAKSMATHLADAFNRRRNLAEPDEKEGDVRSRTAS